MKIGIIASAGGSVISEVYTIIQNSTSKNFQFYVLTDRECGLEKFCDSKSIPWKRITEPDNVLFSLKARQYFESVGGVDLVVLFYLRLVTEEVFEHFPVFNIHPSLLPAYKGFNPIKKLLKDKGKFLGGTLHLVDKSVDGGAIIAQTVMPISILDSEERLNKYSFIQKVYLTLVLIDLFQNKAISILEKNHGFVINNNLPSNATCNPKLVNMEFLDGFLSLQKKENVDVIIE